MSIEDRLKRLEAAVTRARYILGFIAHNGPWFSGTTPPGFFRPIDEIANEWLEELKDESHLE